VLPYTDPAAEKALPCAGRWQAAALPPLRDRERRATACLSRHPAGRFSPAGGDFLFNEGYIAVFIDAHRRFRVFAGV
jgi:hypothetical protein